MLDKKTLLLAQVFISCFMAFLMTGIFGAINLGLGADFPIHWAKAFVTAWPIAFVLSMIVGPVSFRLARFVRGRVMKA